MGELSRAVVIGAAVQNESDEAIAESLDELEALLKTLDIPVVGRLVQRRQRFVARSLIGEGKIEEAKTLAKDQGADLLVFDHELTAMQVANLEKMTDLKIFDRTAIILEIFSEHARTNQAKTQVEIAKLEYLLPRLKGAWSHFQRQKGGGALMRGMGETQIEMDRRRAKERITRLQDKLKQIEKEHETQSKGRQEELKVALIGYTNSGKTSLMNAMTKAELKAKDELFATLDAQIKVIDPRTRPKILLSDTVGFIRNLPHSLIASFRSTLAHVREADLLLHVVDCSYPSFREHIKTSLSVLKEIGADQIPSIIVFNKRDLVDDEVFLKILRKSYEHCAVVSANDLADMQFLREHIYQFFEKFMGEENLEIDVHDKETLSFVYKNCMILTEGYDEEQEKVLFRIRASKKSIARLVQCVAVDREAR